jgi:hypothetical protein
MELLAGRGFSDFNVARRIPAKFSPRRFEILGKKHVMRAPDTCGSVGIKIWDTIISLMDGARLLVKMLYRGLKWDSATANAYMTLWDRRSRLCKSGRYCD